MRTQPLRYEADVVIVGGGLAGLVTALELLGKGRRVVLFDRDVPERLGGLARESFGGIFLVDTPHQRRLGIRDSPDLAWADWQRCARFGPDDSWPHAGMGFSRAAVPGAERAFQDCDTLLAVGTRFAEIPTGSFGARVPETLVHIDLDPQVLGANYPTRVAIAGDSRVVLPRTLILPSDFNCMGYAVPAAVGARLAHPDRPVVAVVGDGAFLMTGLELLTARRMKVGVVCCVFHDGELSQISQGQEVAYNRKTCTVIGDVRFEGIAQAVGARYVLLPGDTATMRRTLQEALEWAADGDSVIVEVPIDYSRRTRFTQGVVKTVMARFPTGDRLRFVGRALWRRLWG